MKPDRHRLLRLRRIERIRAIASHAAAAQAAEAEGTLAQLLALRERTVDIQASYDPRHADDGASLLHMVRFREGLSRITAQTDTDIDNARTAADRRQDERRHAEKRRAHAQDRAEDCRRMIERGGQFLPTPGRKAIWHDT
ncbi:hypothetical protein [Croceicoccus mobilis]|uniref:Flagellar FliJ protein n=1 Tax=Croceicoccus mobilis TaxID=1703339 RepID=A0A916YW96_9SPHN|nr:hypothetical protein [Croceicoccus mobilis]GGD64301.1 hypothetical protein GCM10010990_12200 [Croceicoccus mobilis]